MNASGKIFRTREESRRKVADTEKRDAGGLTRLGVSRGP